MRRVVVRREHGRQVFLHAAASTAAAAAGGSARRRARRRAAVERAQRASERGRREAMAQKVLAGMLAGQMDAALRTAFVGWREVVGERAREARRG